MKTKQYLETLICVTVALLKFPGNIFLSQIEKRNMPSIKRSHEFSSDLNADPHTEVKVKENLLVDSCHVSDRPEKESVIKHLKKELALKRLNKINHHMIMNESYGIPNSEIGGVK